ncbi:putative alkaline shock family protein YloU [Friedmanniella endophytica]|uniref:Putative alkaline shock family protein YloU n=1 Tax=Microlunatus kandeliicorticis TaxID=1759536 RepID=A0A7W3IW24_9ACTN|nr:Asp23/Gls24 family envelope stress response protein [Microlunatus kandeliicorticis]MBA8796235.1 putative alkaline shock family protein YloU [Microlunatus kandeliicorticis]
MSQSVVPATGEERRQAERQAERDAAKQQEQAQPKTLDALHTEHGDTTIADTVVAKIAGIAAREVQGVFAMGNAARRAIGNLTQRIPGASQTNVTGGVSVEKGESQTAIDISVVVEYGVSIVDVSDQIRENVIRAVEYGTGLEVVSVDVNVSDVHLPEDDDAADQGGVSAGNDELR